MMAIVLGVLVTLSVVTAIMSGRTELVSSAILQSGEEAVKLILTLGGGICLWSGMMKVAEAAGFAQIISNLLEPITSRIFRGVKKGSPAAGAIAMNLAANLLGLGNAATPLGIAAVRAMEQDSPQKGMATDDMVLFVVMNTASIQLIPATTAMLRLAAGSTAPMEILPAVWLASAVSVAVGVMVAKVLAGATKRHL